MFRSSNEPSRLDFRRSLVSGQQRLEIESMNHHDSVFSLFFVASSLFDVAGGLQSKQNAGLGLSEQQQGCLFQTNVVNST